MPRRQALFLRANGILGLALLAFGAWEYWITGLPAVATAGAAVVGISALCAFLWRRSGDPAGTE